MMMAAMRSLLTPVALLFVSAVADAQTLGLQAVLAEPVLAPNQATVEVKVFTGSRVPAVEIPKTSEEWERSAAATRRRVLDEIVLRGEAASWRDAKTRIEWLDEISADGYRIRKLRYEAIPGLWIPALLYEPEGLSGKVPAVLNVNGHDRDDGKAADYKQIRSINQAKRGLLALNVEWIGMGQLNTPGFSHYKINQLDLLGTSGVALHYLAQKRAIDLLLAHPNADPERLAVTGLSGGGWQTIFIGSLDERVALANPVAGYSSFVTRAQFPAPDLGDSEQTPSDLATVADYTHLTAMRAPRPTLLTHNARDTCCFKAEYALPPLLHAARPAFRLFDRPDALRSHVNQDPGHNYGQDNREAFYRMLRDFFFAGSEDELPTAEIDVSAEIRTGEQLAVPLPEDNLDIRRIAMRLAAELPARSTPTRRELQAITRTPRYDVEAQPVGEPFDAGFPARRLRLRMSGDWTVPAVEIAPPNASETVVLFADGGRASVSGEAREHLAQGRRVVAIDPYFFGESRPEPKDWLWSLLIAAVGERPLGIQAGQIAAATRWARSEHGGTVRLHAVGPRTSLAALIAAALEPDAAAAVEVEESFESLAEIIERDLDARDAPELFCFGLLERFELDGIRELIRPRPLSLNGR